MDARDTQAFDDCLKEALALTREWMPRWLSQLQVGLKDKESSTSQMGEKQGLIHKSPAILARELFDAYRKNKQSQKRIGEILVNLFEDSTSFATAKARIGYLEELELWDPSYAPRLEAALVNSQVAGSWGVPERVQKLVKKWTVL